MPLLALKLLLVPSFLLSISLVERRYGPARAGWIAGMPMVTGPILFVLALERGAEFTRVAAAASASAAFAVVAFGLAYAWSSRRVAWPAALALALVAWGCAVWGLSLLPSPQHGWIATALTLAFGAKLFPPGHPRSGIRPLGLGNLAARMAGGAVLTLLVTWASGHVGSAWSGLIAVFPLLATVLAVSTHVRDGPEYTALLLRGMATGMYAFSAFCLTLTALLGRVPILPAFGAAIAAGLFAQVLTRRIHPAPARAVTSGPEGPR